MRKKYSLKFEVRGSRFEVRGLRFEVRGLRFEVNTPTIVKVLTVVTNRFSPLREITRNFDRSIAILLKQLSNSCDG